MAFILDFLALFALAQGTQADYDRAAALPRTFRGKVAVAEVKATLKLILKRLARVVLYLARASRVDP